MIWTWFGPEKDDFRSKLGQNQVREVFGGVRGAGPAGNPCLGWPCIRKVLVTPTPSTFLKVLPYKWGAYCRTNGRRTAVQMGGVLQGFPFFEGSKLRRQESTPIQMGGRTAVQIGGVLPYFLDKF